MSLTVIPLAYRERIDSSRIADLVTLWYYLRLEGAVYVSWNRQFEGAKVALES